MCKVWYVVSFYSANGVWIELPRCSEADVAAYLVKAMLRASENVGEVVKVVRWVEQNPEG